MRVRACVRARVRGSSAAGRGGNSLAALEAFINVAACCSSWPSNKTAYARCYSMGGHPATRGASPTTPHSAATGRKSSTTKSQQHPCDSMVKRSSQKWLGPIATGRSSIGSAHQLVSQVRQGSSQAASQKLVCSTDGVHGGDGVYDGSALRAEGVKSRRAAQRVRMPHEHACMRACMRAQPRRLKSMTRRRSRVVQVMGWAGTPPPARSAEPAE